MKNLIFINGVMGVGKSATSKALQNLLPNCVMLDGDWCWDAKPFIVNDETKTMVIENICFLLNNFLSSSAYDNIIFCWVMHDKQISDKILDKLNLTDCFFKSFTLSCSNSSLISRLKQDIDYGIREESIIENSINYSNFFNNLFENLIDTSILEPKEIAKEIYDLI